MLPRKPIQRTDVVYPTSLLQQQFCAWLRDGCGRDESGKLIPIDIKVGDRVLFGKWSGTEVKLDGEELLIMKESDIMGVLS